MAGASGGVSGVVSAARGAAQIALNLGDFQFALLLLKGRISTFKDAISSIPPPEPPAGSPAIIAFAEGLSEVISVALSMSDLFAANAASFEKARDAKIEQDNILAAKLRSIAAAGAIAATGAATTAGAAAGAAAGASAAGKVTASGSAKKTSAKSKPSSQASYLGTFTGELQQEQFLYSPGFGTPYTPISGTQFSSEIGIPVSNIGEALYMPVSGAQYISGGGAQYISSPQMSVMPYTPIGGQLSGSLVPYTPIGGTHFASTIGTPVSNIGTTLYTPVSGTQFISGSGAQLFSGSGTQFVSSAQMTGVHYAVK